MDDFICVLCNKPGKSGSKDIVAIREKGSEGINRASQERNDDIVTVPGQKVHKKCRQEYCKRQNIERAKEPNAASSSQNRRPSVRSVESLFSFQTDCFYCGSEVVFQSVDKKSRSGDAFKWSGLMQSTVTREDDPGKSSVFFLPMLDMDPTSNTCIYSTLKFMAEHAQRHGVIYPIVTFDQPLWWKAYNLTLTEPVASAISNVIVRLGAFHTEVSFLGSIGHLMSKSGLKELIELAYASNAVVHMLTGKAIARAVRGHLLVDAALNTLLFAVALGIPVPQFENKGND